MVLIVDSDETRFALFRCILKGEGLEVKTAETGFDVANILNEDKPIIAIFDSSIKWLNVCDFVATCREMKKYESTSFIILLDREKKIPYCKVSGVEILRYPIRVYEFLSIIDKCIRRIG